MTGCKTPQQIAEEERIKILLEEQAKIDAELDAIAEERLKRGEDDTTDISVGPISIPDDDSWVELEGLFFNMQGGFREEDEPSPALIIEKDVLDRSSGFIIGRFVYHIDARAKIVFKVSLDGKVLDDYGTGLPYGVGDGYHDTTLFKYPNTARANKDGVHKVHVDYGLIVAIAEQGLGLLDWGEVRAKDTADFTIKLLPHKNQD